MILTDLVEEDSEFYNSSIPRNLYLETVYESDGDDEEEGEDQQQQGEDQQQQQTDSSLSCSVEQEDEKASTLHKLLNDRLWSKEATEVLEGLEELVRICGTHSSDKGYDHEDDNKDIRHELVFLGGHLAVIRAMKAFPQSPDIQIQALKLLLRVARSLNSHWLDLLGSMGIVESTLQALKSFPRDAALQRRAYRLLSHLFGNGECSKANVDQFLAQGGLAVIFERLEQQRHSTNMQETKEAQMQACSLFRKLSTWEHAREKMLEMGAVTALAGWIDHSSFSSGGDSGSTFSSRSTLTTVSESNATLSDASLSTVSATALQSMACETMAKLVKKQKKDIKKHRKAQKQMPSVVAPPPLMHCDDHSDDISQMSESIVSPLSDKPKLVISDQQLFIGVITRDLLFQKDPTPALRSIQASLKKSRTEFGRVFLEAGGPLALAKVLAGHMDKKQVQIRGYDVLHQLAKLDGFACVLGELDLVKIVVDGMALHETSESVARDGCNSLYELIFESESNAARLVVEANGIPVLLRAMRRYVDAHKFQYRACQILQLCAPRFKSIILDVENGAVIDAVVQALERNRSHSKTERAAQKCLKALRWHWC